jgi:hypothetical protein
MLSDLQLWHLPGDPPSMFLSVDGGRSRISVSTHQGSHHQSFLALMVGAPESIAPAPLRGPLSTFFSIDGGCSWIYSSDTSQGGHCRCFLALMVGAPGSIAPAPPRGPTIDVFSVDGGHSQISVSTRQGARRRRFLALMVDAPISTAPAPPREPTVDVS